MHLADCMNRDICSWISKHRGLSCTVCTREAVVTWCVSSCFTVMVLLSFLVVRGQLTLFVYLIIALKLFSYYQVNQCTEPVRGTARTQRQLIPEPSVSVVGSSH